MRADKLGFRALLNSLVPDGELLKTGLIAS